MQEWEFCSLVLDAEYIVQYSPDGTLEAYRLNSKENRWARFISDLNALGEKGWEVVACGSGASRVILKRAKSEV